METAAVVSAPATGSDSVATSTVPESTSTDKAEATTDVKPDNTPNADSDSYAKLAAKEKAIARKLTEQKEKESSLSKELDSLRSMAKEYEELKALKSKNPRALLDKLGLSYDDLVNEAIDTSNGSDDSVERIRKELDERFAKLKEEQEEQEFNRLKTENEQKLASFKSHLGQELESSKAEFPLLHSMYDEWGEASSPTEAVFAIIQENWKLNKTVLSTKDAAKLIEGHFNERMERIKAKMGLTTPQVQAEPPKKEPEPKKSIPTLSNKMDPSTIKSESEKQAVMSPEERRAKAKAIIENALSPDTEKRKAAENEERMKQKLLEFKRSRGLI